MMTVFDLVLVDGHCRSQVGGWQRVSTVGICHFYFVANNEHTEFMKMLCK